MSEETYQGVRSRLDEILEEVKREDVSLDDALALYEEAVKLSLSACDLSESDLDLGADQDAPGAPADAVAENGAVEGSEEARTPVSHPTE